MGEPRRCGFETFSRERCNRVPGDGQDRCGDHRDLDVVRDDERDKFAFWLRREWWFNHGCNEPAALYGDDGEMSCAKCNTDFKREDVYALKGKVLARRIGFAQTEIERETSRTLAAANMTKRTP